MFLIDLLLCYSTYLSKGFLPVILEVLRVDVQVVLIDGERLGALGDAGHKLLHLQESAARPVAFKVPHRDVGGSDAICKAGKQGGVTEFKPKVS